MSWLRKVAIVVVAWGAIAVLALFMSGCATIEKTFENRTALDSELPKAERLFQEGKERFNLRRDNYTADELAVVDRGISQIEDGTASMRKHYQKGGVSEVVAFGEFVADWSKVKAGFMLAVGVIAIKDLSEDDALLLKNARAKMLELDGLVSSMIPGDVDLDRYKAVASFVSDTAAFIKSVKSDE